MKVAETAQAEEAASRRRRRRPRAATPPTRSPRGCAIARCARKSHRLQKRQELAFRRPGKDSESPESSLRRWAALRVEHRRLESDRGAEGASKERSPPGNGGHSTSSCRVDEKTSPQGGVPLAGHVPRRGLEIAGDRVREQPRASRLNGKCKGPFQASRDTRASTRGSRFELGSTKIARSESKRVREKSMGFTGADRHPSLADCME